ncbi:MAG TPA: 23S rRNA (guanosine(2251)-2'-O)-methyltransferase RlmB, partial [Caldisericia bacterium]|nr:23S rRNA (guanosine(2251)-2'-O)-methyltransferase RlmB [Caldisericia bacterium]
RKPYGENKPFGERRSYGDRKPYGENRPFGERKSYERRPPRGDSDGDGSPKLSWQKKEWSGPSDRRFGRRDDEGGHRPRFPRQDGDGEFRREHVYERPPSRTGSKFQRRPFEEREVQDLEYAEELPFANEVTLEEADNAIIGKNAVLEAIRAGTSINKVLIRKTLKINTVLKAIMEESKDRGIRYDLVSDFEIGKYGSRDVVALASPTQYAEIEDLIGPENTISMIAILDGIEDPQNLGAIIRSSECFGASGVIIPKHGAAPVTSTVTKTSAGAALRQKIARVANVKIAIEKLKEAGYWIYGSSPDATSESQSVEFPDKCCFIIGSEGEGMHKTVAEHCDEIIKIPMKGKLGSLNASVAAAILMYEWAKKHPQQPDEKVDEKVDQPTIEQ